jgi:hypothetical protein
MGMTKIQSVSLQRGPCYGRCPVYEVTFASDGAAIWHGESFIERIGDYRGELDEADFERLALFIEQCGFFDWDDEYAAPVTDNPSHDLRVARGSEVKHVHQYGTDEPADFWTVATLIDGLALHVEWKRDR